MEFSPDAKVFNHLVNSQGNGSMIIPRQDECNLELCFTRQIKLGRAAEGSIASKALNDSHLKHPFGIQEASDTEEIEKKHESDRIPAIFKTLKKARVITDLIDHLLGLKIASLGHRQNVPVSLNLIEIGIRKYR